MLTTKEVRGVRVCRANKPGKEYTKDGLPRRKRKIGKIFKTVFSPDGLRVVGFIVRRPDLLWMIKRPERFLALDAMDVVDGVIVATKGSASWDDHAIARLDVNYDKCILWEGIQVKTTEGAEIGHVDEISFDENTGELNSLFLDDGGTARALIGTVEIPRDLMVGYRKGVLIVKPEADELSPSGGLAAKAGVATAQAKQTATNGVEVVTKTAGKLVGRAKDAIIGARDEFRKECGPSEKQKAAKESGKAAASSSAGTTSKAPVKVSTTTKASTSTKTTTPAKAAKTAQPADKKSSQSAAEAIGNHMKAAGSMFSDFKKEFDKAKKD